MTSQFSTTKQPIQLEVTTSAATRTSNKEEKLWQRMFNAWVDTYELSYRSGAVPFLLM
jgi:hypothetical protein